MDAIQSPCALVGVPPSLMRADLERREPCGQRFINHTGAKFDHCEVVGLAGFLKQYPAWLCKCECGNQFIVRANALYEQGPGCGCRQTTHGLSGTYWASTYRGIMERCYNPECRAYHYYGGRGIKVCRRWRESIQNFVDDMGPRPSDEHSIDRMDNEGDYEKSNCRWATREQQATNKRGLRWIEHKGERLTLSDWSKRIDITRERLRQRVDICLELNADLGEAIDTPAGETMPCLIAEQARRREIKAAYRDSHPGAAITNKSERMIAPVRHLLDGQVHHLLAEDASQLTGGRFDYVMRLACKAAGLKCSIRGLGDHILFRAS